MALADQVAVVILNYNGRKYLERFLPDVMLHSGKASVYIVDNGSTDGSTDFVESQYPAAGLIKFEKNFGYSGGYNRALKEIEAEIYVLLNTDVQVTPGWLTPVIDLMSDNDEIAACQPKLLSYHHQDFFEYAGAGGGFIDFLGFPFCSVSQCGSLSLFLCLWGC